MKQPDDLLPETPAPAPRWRGGFRIGLIVLALLVAAVLDIRREPQAQLTAKALLAAIDLYQATLSPLLGQMGASCRFQPTCSHYGEQAIRLHGTIRGLRLTTVRILRCGPWTAAGSVDPPPTPATTSGGAPAAGSG